MIFWVLLMSRNRYCLVEHQYKAKAFSEALWRVGFRGHRRLDDARFLLIDHEFSGLFAGTTVKWREQVVKAGEMGIPIFVYPHSVRPNVPYDLTDYWYPVSTLFTIGEGHARVLDMIGYPNPVEVVGWPYGEIRDFDPPSHDGKLKVLFAPIHPVGNIWLPDDEKELNARTLRLLLELTDRIDLTVRFIGKLAANGLWVDTRALYKKALPDGSTDDVERADVVIAAFTMAYTAIALGKPLVMLGEGIRPHNSPRGNGKLVYARNWEVYRDYMRYPYNVEDCKTSKSLWSTIQKAIAGSAQVRNWRERFIGEPFNGPKFVAKVKSYVVNG